MDSCPKPHEGRWAKFIGGDSESSWYACPHCGETWSVIEGLTGNPEDST